MDRVSKSYRSSNWPETVRETPDATGLNRKITKYHAVSILFLCRTIPIQKTAQLHKICVGHDGCAEIVRMKKPISLDEPLDARSNRLPQNFGFTRGNELVLDENAVVRGADQSSRLGSRIEG